MLAHTSGIMEFQRPTIRKEIEGKNVNNVELKNVFVKIKPKLDFTPGTKWNYSNTNYLFLALIIEKISGKSYSQFIDKYIFRKAKMKSSYVLESGVPNNMKGKIVERYYRDGVLSPKIHQLLKLLALSKDTRRLLTIRLVREKSIRPQEIYTNITRL